MASRCGQGGGMAGRCGALPTTRPMARPAAVAPVLGVMLAVMLGLGGCTTVEPWQRGTLAKPQMAVEPLPLQSGLRTRVQATRQGAVMGTAAEGGGCGCY